jgi:hypothetical protein
VFLAVISRFGLGARKHFLWRRLFVRRARIIYVIRKVFAIMGAAAPGGRDGRVAAGVLQRFLLLSLDAERAAVD